MLLTNPMSLACHGAGKVTGEFTVSVTWENCAAARATESSLASARPAAIFAGSAIVAVPSKCHAAPSADHDEVNTSPARSIFTHRSPATPALTCSAAAAVSPPWLTRRRKKNLFNAENAVVACRALTVNFSRIITPHLEKSLAWFNPSIFAVTAPSPRNSPYKK
ncbi:MAG: hypothetical protein LBK60_04855 [Verrucomicrobiales bacterium]|nr:hypothetical protein [Verrucomicrobiales bacterium]